MFRKNNMLRSGTQFFDDNQSFYKKNAIIFLVTTEKKNFQKRQSNFLRNTAWYIPQKFENANRKVFKIASFCV